VERWGKGRDEISDPSRPQFTREYTAVEWYVGVRSLVNAREQKESRLPPTLR